MRRKETERANFGGRGIGLYSYQQEKNTTPFQYFGQLIIGLFCVGLGLLRILTIMAIRKQEIAVYGSAESHFWAWLTSIAILLVGLFWAHAGAIFYGRRITSKLIRHRTQGRGANVHRNL